jgi:hypothetical protein
MRYGAAAIISSFGAALAIMTIASSSKTTETRAIMPDTNPKIMENT